MQEPSSSDLLTLRHALGRFAWREAYELSVDLTPGTELAAEDLEGLGEAAWWIGKMDESIAFYERAYAAHLEAANEPRASYAAVELAKNNLTQGSSSIGFGWMKRAERLLEGKMETSEGAHFLRTQGVIAFEGHGDLSAAVSFADQALELATRLHDPTLMALALHDKGRVLVARGDVTEGMELIDEATIAAVSGEISPMATAAIYCNTISSCEHLADFRRAGEWSDAARRWCERQAIAGFPGMCRVYRAEIMRMRGDWVAAEKEARHACEELKGFNQGYAAEAVYEVGVIRLSLGDQTGAEEAFQQAHELGRHPQPALAELRLMQGDVGAADSYITRALVGAQLDLERARFLPTAIQIAVAQEDLGRAAALVEELERIADLYGSDALRAAARTGRGALRLLEGAESEAVLALQEAVRLWQSIDAPYPAARTRVLLGRALAEEGHIDGAQVEFRAAHSTLTDLGAVPALREVEVLLDSKAPRKVLHSTDRTFMFTDIVNSTNLLEVIGDEAWSSLVAWHDDMMRAQFGEHEGEEVDHAGDGFFVAFVDPAEAVRCAVGIQRKLSSHRKAHGFAPSVRIGLHRAEVSQAGQSYQGKGVHAAARIAAIANGGEIVASEASVRDLPHLTLLEPRRLTLKGLKEPVDLLSVDWTKG
jgi:class 3 adenylate cyclase